MDDAARHLRFVGPTAEGDLDACLRIFLSALSIRASTCSLRHRVPAVADVGGLRVPDDDFG